MQQPIMTQGTVRIIFRWIHILFSIPILGYIYDSPADTPNYAWGIRYVMVPVIVLSGLWMWKGHLVRRLIRRERPARMKTGQELEA
ncbi:MAG: hypothetical protein WA817_01845 [Candidatus Acidiferrum sp.]